MLKSPVKVKVKSTLTPVERITQSVIVIEPQDKVLQLITLLKEKVFESVIVFTRTKHGADRLKKKLDKVNIKSNSNTSENISQKWFEVNSRIKQNILINSKNTDSWINDLSEAQDEGNIFHQIMEGVNSKKEINIVLNRFYQSGLIGLSDMKYYEKKMRPF